MRLTAIFSQHSAGAHKGKQKPDEKNAENARNEFVEYRISNTRNPHRFNLGKATNLMLSFYEQRVMQSQAFAETAFQKPKELIRIYQSLRIRPCAAA